MKPKYFLLVIFTVLFLSIMSIVQPVLGQTPKHQEKLNLGLSFYHSSLVVGELSTFSGSYELFAAVPVGSNIKIYGILPFTTFSQKSGNKESYSGIGNLILGVKHNFGEKKNNSVKVGIALPTIGDSPESINANLYSYLSRIYDLEKFTPDYATLFAESQYKYLLDENFYVGGGAGLKFLVWTGSGSHDAELYLPFNIFFGYEKQEIIRATAAFKGIFYLTNEHADFGEDVMDLIQLKVSYPGLMIEPGLVLESPINDIYQKWLDYNVGLFLLVKI